LEIERKRHEQLMTGGEQRREVEVRRMGERR